LGEKSSYPDEDHDLIARCKTGDERAFEDLVHKYQQTVFNLVFHHLGHRADLEDVAQKVFIKVYLSLGRFDNKRPFFPWLYRIVRNQCYDELRQLRRSKVRTFTDLSLEEVETIERLIGQGEVAPRSDDERKEMHDLLFTLLDRLPEKQRTAVILRDLEEIPYDKMAQTLGWTEQAARLKVFRGRARLKELMERALRRRAATRR